MNTLQAFVRAYPDSSFAYTSLAQGFMKTQQFAKAKVNFEKSLKIVKSSDIKAPSVADYLQDMVNAASSKL